MKTSKFMAGFSCFVCNLLLALTATMGPSIGVGFAGVCALTAMIVAGILMIDSLA